MAHSKPFGLDLEILKRLSRDKLIRLLEEAPGPKELIIDGELMKLLDRIADAKILRAHGVGKMFRFERVPPSTSASQIVYLLQPTLINIKYMADHVHTLRIENPLQVHVICVPRVTSGATLLLEEEGLHGVVALHEFTPEFVPLDHDLLSLEMHSFFRDAFLESDLSGCVAVAKALATVRSLYGDFVRVSGHGRAAHAVMKALSRGREERGMKPQATNKIGHLLLLDRDADYVSPLLTQLTYEGAVDEHYGIRAGVVEFPKEVSGEERPSKVALNSRDAIFENIRNRHFGGVANHLLRKARDLQDRKQAASTMTPAQIKNFVTNDLRSLQEMQKSLSLHLSACEGITTRTRKDFDTQLETEHGLVTGSAGLGEAKAYIEDCIARQLPSKFTLRLVCLLSITQQGLSRKEYEHLATQIFHSYGYHHMITLFRLRRLGLLLLADSAEEQAGSTGMRQNLLQVVSSLGGRKSCGHWRTLVKKLSLIPDAEDQIDLHNPTHISYVFNGAYTPLIPHLVSETLTKGFSSLSDALKLVPGTSFASVASGDAGASPSVPKVVLVMILGGITYAEVASLRLLGVSLGTKIIIASTNTVTGASLVQAALHGT